MNVPTIFTSINCILACILLFLVQGKYIDISLVFTIAITCVYLDFFDGFFARRFDKTSPFGKNLDALTDVICFGIVPALLIPQIISDLSGIFFSVLFIFVNVIRHAKLLSDSLAGGVQNPVVALMIILYLRLNLSIPLIFVKLLLLVICVSLIGNWKYFNHHRLNVQDNFTFYSSLLTFNIFYFFVILGNCYMLKIFFFSLVLYTFLPIAFTFLSKKYLKSLRYFLSKLKKELYEVALGYVMSIDWLSSQQNPTPKGNFFSTGVYFENKRLENLIKKIESGEEDIKLFSKYMLLGCTLALPVSIFVGPIMYILENRLSILTNGDYSGLFERRRELYRKMIKEYSDKLNPNYLSFHRLI